MRLSLDGFGKVRPAEPCAWPDDLLEKDTEVCVMKKGREDETEGYLYALETDRKDGMSHVIEKWK
jgi:hypothetical protein